MACPRCGGQGREDGFYGVCESCTAELRAWAAKQAEAIQARAVEVQAEKAAAAELVDNRPWWNRTL